MVVQINVLTVSSLWYASHVNAKGRRWPGGSLGAGLKGQVGHKIQPIFDKL